MPDPIAPPPPIPAVAVAGRVPPTRRPPAGGAAGPVTREPLTVEVAQAPGGVFVYTLKDPGTGAVLAVIPRSQARPGPGGRLLDRHV